MTNWSNVLLRYTSYWHPSQWFSCVIFISFEITSVMVHFITRSVNLRHILSNARHALWRTLLSFTMKWIMAGPHKEIYTRLNGTVKTVSLCVLHICQYHETIQISILNSPYCTCYCKDVSFFVVQLSHQFEKS